MMNEILEPADGLKSEVMSAFALNRWMQNHPNALIVAVIPLEGMHILVIYEVEESEGEKIVKGFGD